jgi:methylated-DNA-[protein]-cysteine S-methyltransferase
MQTTDQYTASFIFPSPLGNLAITASNEHILSVLFDNQTTPAEVAKILTTTNHPLIQNCCNQLQEYFGGTRKQFDLPLQQSGTAFQQKVWSALSTIDYGSTITYLVLSKRIGNTKAIRAVGTANGCNKLSIIVPCHRVIGSNGTLIGYSGELWRKKWLLDHESKYGNGHGLLF